MKVTISALVFLFLPVSTFALNQPNPKDQPQTIYINNEIPVEILRAYNEQAALISEMRLKIQKLEQQLYYSNERLTNLEAEVWEMTGSNQMHSGGENR